MTIPTSSAHAPKPPSHTELGTHTSTFSSSLHVDRSVAPSPRLSQVQLTDQTNLLPTKQLIICFLGLSVCTLVSQLDTVITATSLSTISDAFNAGSISSWVPSAYLPTSTSFSPLYGRFSDIFGRKATLSAALCMLMIGNLVAGFSRSIIQVIVARGIAGAGGGAIHSLAQIVISDIVSLRERGKYQAIIASVVATGMGVGPVIGGAITQKAGWRWSFWFTIPIVLCAVFTVNLVLPLKPVQGSMKDKIVIIDYLGSGLALIACTLILLPLIWGGVTFLWSSPIIIGTLAGGLIVWIGFVMWERRGAKLPVVPMYIFKHSTVCGVYIAGVVNGVITFSVMFHLPQFFQVALGYTPIHAGVFLIPTLVSQVALNQVAGQIMSRTGQYKGTILSGFAVWSIACGLFSTMTPHTPQGLMVVFMLLSGVGSGQTLQTTTVAAQASVPRKDMAVVTAFRNFVRMLGGALGLAIGSAIINNTLRASLQGLSLPGEVIKKVIDSPTILSHPDSLGLSEELETKILYDGYIQGFRRVFILNASLAAGIVIASIFLIKQKDLTREDDDQRRKETQTSTELPCDAEKHPVTIHRHERPTSVKSSVSEERNERCPELSTDPSAVGLRTV